MTAWTPDYQILIDNVDYSSYTIASFNITRGRQNIYEQAVAGYCYLDIVNLNGASLEFEIGHQVLINVKNSAGNWVGIYGGFITDINKQVVSTGSNATVVGATITALGTLARLSRATWDGALSKDQEGDQIYAILSDVVASNWSEVPTEITWATYSPPNETWANAANLGVGAIDQPGLFEMVARGADPVNAYTYVAQLANSALGTIYEDDQGRISYADADSRQDYYLANGFTELSANEAFGVGLSAVTRSGDVRNAVNVVYGNGSTLSDSDIESINAYGKYAEIFDTTLHDASAAQDFLDRILQLRSFPQSMLQSITYPLTNPELSNTDRDALLDVFVGQPIRISDLPSQISTIPFEGFVEGWTFRAGVNSLSLTLIVSPLSYSGYAQRWEQVSSAELWNTINATLQWKNAIGVIS
jgi:hypothetical protein